ncbi:MAG: glycine zipper family protein [Dongiaceae bacterium]
MAGNMSGDAADRYAGDDKNAKSHPRLRPRFRSDRKIPTGHAGSAFIWRTLHTMTQYRRRSNMRLRNSGIVAGVSFIGVLFLGLLVIEPHSSFAYSRSYCEGYARDYADQASWRGSGRGALGGAARGAAGGAIFGAIAGNAGRGAAIGAGVGAIAGGARRANNWSYYYSRAYDDCVRG